MGLDFDDLNPVEIASDVYEKGKEIVSDGADLALAAANKVGEFIATGAGLMKDGVTYSWGFATTAAEDAGDAAQQAYDDAARAAGKVWGTVRDSMGQLYEDWVDPVIDDAKQLGEDVGKGMVDGAKALGEGAADAADATWSAAGDVTDFGLSTTDTLIFDPVETMSFGLVAPNYENGNLSVEAGVPGVFYGSATIGEGGIGAQYEDLVSAYGGHLGTDGSFGVNGRAGLDIADLPGAKGHIERGSNGEMSIDGRAQAIIPTPVGILDGSMHGGFQQNPDGSWSTVHEAEATMYTPDGAYSGNLNVQVADDGHGNTDVNAGAGGGYKGYDGSGGDLQLDYMHDEEDGTTTDGVTAKGHMTADGADVNANVGVTHVDSPDGSTTTVETHTTVDADDVHVDGGGTYQHQEKADGTTSDTVDVNVDGQAGDTEFHGDGHYDHTQNADGSESEDFSAHANAKGDDWEAGAGAEHTYDRDAEGHESETDHADVHVKSDDFEAGGTYDHDRTENDDGTVTEHTDLSGSGRAGDYAAGGELHNTTETSADGTETSRTHTSGHIDGVDVPGLPDGLDGPPDFDDVMHELGVPTPDDALNQIPTPDDALSQIPTPDDALSQIPRPDDALSQIPDLDSLPDQIPGLGQLPEQIPGIDHLPDAIPGFDQLPQDIPGLGDLTDIPEVDQALSELPDIPDVDLPDVGALPDVPFADQMPSQADVVGALASSGDLSGVLGQVQDAVPEEAAGAIQAVATYVQEGNFDDFTGDVVAAEVNEAAADEVWDDLG